MSTTIAPAPIFRSIQVKAGPVKAFEVFTAGMTRWWIKSHTINSSPQKEVIIEPCMGGRWFERGEDGSECEWAASSPGSRVKARAGVADRRPMAL